MGRVNKYLQLFRAGNAVMGIVGVAVASFMAAGTDMVDEWANLVISAVVVFMFLLFLMAATVMRETTLNVQRAEGVPQTSRMRLQRTQDIAFIYLAPSDAAVDRRYRDRGYALLLNGCYAPVRRIEDFVKTEKGIVALGGYRSITFRVASDPQVDKAIEERVKAHLYKAVAEDTARYRVR